VKIGACFIAAIIVVSFASRLNRACELRSPTSCWTILHRFMQDCATRKIRLIANEPDARDLAEYQGKTRQEREEHDIPPDADIAAAHP
jgi:hypothetical protein